MLRLSGPERCLFSSQRNLATIFWLFDGTRRTVIASASFPDGEEGALIARFPAHRARLFESIIVGVRQHLRDAVSRHEEGPLGAPSQLGFVDMLEELGYIAGTAPGIAFVGSARFFDPTAPEFSLLNAFPNDAHFALDPSISPYGTAGIRMCMLTGARVGEGENGSAKVCHGSGGIVLLRAG